MGIDVDVVICDWNRLLETLNRVPLDGIWSLAGPDWDPDLEPDAAQLVQVSPTEHWLARYEFRGAASSGTAKPYFHFDSIWDDARKAMPAPLRQDMEKFIGRLLWTDYNGTANLLGDFEPPLDSIDKPLRIACTPTEIADLARHWTELADRIPDLRPYIDPELAPGYLDNFDELAVYLEDWGNAVRQAQRRSWGLIALFL
ncbi:hypothetical protein [Nocardia sp. NPDC052566]|uniref:hypothetical protein n=1 Tax=Nocardia sp. NPDC052566 TaxID=3364330 RepID=UPI0037C5A4EC